MKKLIGVTLTVVLLLLCVVIFTIPKQLGNNADTSYNPLSDVKKFEKTLSCVKLDSNGNAIGTEQIAIILFADEDLLNSDAHEISITPFGGLPKLIFGNELDGSPPKPRKIADEFWCLHWVTPLASDNLISGQVYYSLDFEYWAFSHELPNNESLESKSVYYVASTSETRTTEEIVEFFQGLVPHNKSK